MKKEIRVHPKFKIVRGVYLTGVGQEKGSYYFKIPVNHEDFNKIERGSVCLSFYQGEEFVTALPAIIRTDAILTGHYPVQAALKQEINRSYPLLPILSVLDSFDEIKFQNILNAWKMYEKELRKLSSQIIAKENRNEDEKNEHRSKTNFV
ncbi:hypothetical protein [Enterococcus sp. CWB-B31]|uniref:hypothetical protein n=1 Tax=Enterococcus sp. CWB-B31 TaxID=2885159 RepID=UPI001E54304D|nr:hypothetical protein [Enterococcus sp. CWB-B31]MCB5953980.1 hypothetical protein [Enterococcus sp. CWB-B31]